MLNLNENKIEFQNVGMKFAGKRTMHDVSSSLIDYCSWL